MNTFVNAARQQPDSLTENQARTFASSLSSNVDFFFRAGASRGKAEELVSIFNAAYREDPKIAIRNLLWARDARNGAGERELFRTILKRLPSNVKQALVPFVPEFGRWDDLEVLIEESDSTSTLAAATWQLAVQGGHGLACKWAPRKGEVAVKLRNLWGMSPKQYRKTIVNGTNVVEQKMCAKQWFDINFEHVPSVAAARYRKAFERNALTAYMQYKERLDKGEAKINASAIYPHDVIRSAYQRGASESVADAQWKALPNYVQGGGVLCMADVSGSMSTAVSGSVTAMDISVALALYTSERLTGPFKNLFMTFSSNPGFITVNPNQSLRERALSARNAEWGMSTDLNKAFAAILKMAIENNVPQSDMPSTLLIVSDMEFDNCGHLTNYQAVVNMYKQHGYEVPNIVFWNVNSRTQNVPVRFDQRGVALISGFSPSILQSVLGAEDMTPESIMLKTLMKDRYTIDGLTS